MTYGGGCLTAQGAVPSPEKNQGNGTAATGYSSENVMLSPSTSMVTTFDVNEGISSVHLIEFIEISAAIQTADGNCGFRQSRYSGMFSMASMMVF